MRRHLLVLLIAALSAAGSVHAAWSSAASGTGAAKGRQMPGGNPPAASFDVLSRIVTVTWTASSFAGGGTVAGYVVKRFNTLAPGVGETLVGSCAGTVSGTSCTETGILAGTWQYTVTPAQGAWRGAESGRSNSVTTV